MSTIESIAGTFLDVYVVFDGLDACRERDEVITLLGVMHGWEFDTLHLLVTSRPAQSIEERLSHLVSHTILVDKNCVNGDIRVQVPMTRDNSLDDTSLNRLKRASDFSLSARPEVNILEMPYGDAWEALAAGHHGMPSPECGVDVDAQGGQEINGLQAASSQGDDGIVRLPDDYGADMNAEGKQNGISLQTTPLQDHDLIVRSIIKVCLGLIIGFPFLPLSPGSLVDPSKRKLPLSDKVWDRLPTIPPPANQSSHW